MTGAGGRGDLETMRDRWKTGWTKRGLRPQRSALNGNEK